MKKIISYILGVLPMMLLLAGCTQTEFITDMPSQRVTVEAQMPASGQTRAALFEIYNSKDLQTSWQDGDEVQLIITQNDQKFDLGLTPVTAISSDGKSASFSYNIPTGVNIYQAYTLYVFSGTKGIVDQDRTLGWYAYCPTQLTRTELSQLKAPLFSQVEVTASCPLIQMQHFVSYELLHIKNTISSDISFRHDGFYVDIPWYRGSANVFFDSSWDPTKLPSEWEDEAQSENVTIPAKDEAAIISYYLPSGYKMKDATLKAIINGKSVTSSNKKSSDVTVRQGQAYHLYATWDGNELTFDGGDAPLVKTISVNPDRLDFGTLTVDEGKSETFMVSNTGTAPLTYTIAATTGDFSIEGSGQAVTLQPGASHVYSVVFKPSIEDHQFSEVVEITTDATNGTQYLALVGASEKKRIDHVIPPEYKDRMDPYITIYEGANPPNIEGIYLLSPNELTYDATNQFEIGHVFSDMYFRFYNQDMVNNTLDYQEKQKSSGGSGTGCFISGEGNNFTVYFNVDVTSRYEKYDISLKQALVISGTKTDDGIKNLEYAFVIVDKSSDPDQYVIDPGDFRAFKDGDGMGITTTWPTAIRTRAARALPLNTDARAK